MTDSTNFDLYIRTLLDKQSTQQVESGVKSLNKSLDEVEKHVHDINQVGHDPGLVKAMEDAAKTAKDKLNPALDQAVKHQKELRTEAKRAAEEASAQARIWNIQASQMLKQIVQVRAQAAGSIRASSVIGTVSRGGLIAGSAIVGGAFAESNRYAKEAEDAGKATEATKAWTAATKELATARSRVDAVLLKETLPLLQQAAKVAAQAADFVEKNPEIVSAALKVGEVVAGLGAIGLLVSKGIKLYADVTYIKTIPLQLEAARLQAAAAEQQLVAAQLQAESKGIETATAPVSGGGAGVSGKIGTIALYASSVIIGANIGLAIGNAINKALDPKATTTTWKDIGDEAKKILAIGAYKIGESLTPISKAGEATQRGLIWYEKVAQALGLLSNNADKASESLSNVVTNSLAVRGSKNEGQVISAFEKWKEDDAKLVEEATKKRTEIIANSEKEILKSNEQYASQIVSINKQADKQQATLLANYQKASIQSEEKYQDSRAKTIKDASKAIQDIEAASQERLRKLTQDHNDRVLDLARSRDALGLAKEQQQFDRAKSEEARSTNAEIEKRRADAVEQLKVLAEEHQAEMAQRLAEFQQAQAQAQADRKEKLREAADAHAQELAQLRQQRAAQLRELQQTLDAERLQRRNQFIAQLRDLDANLLGERNLKLTRYNQMLTDVEGWLTKYRAQLQSLATVKAPVHDFSGYAYPGVYQMAADGQKEFVMSGGMTKAAENIIGSGLTELKMMAALMRNKNSNNVNWDYRPRFEGEYTQSMSLAVRKDARRVVGEIFRSLSS